MTDELITQIAATLSKKRSRASGNLVTLVHLGCNDVKSKLLGAREPLKDAVDDHAALGVAAPADAEYLAAMTLLDAAEAFVLAAEDARPIIAAPNNWRPVGSDIDNALRPLGV